MEIGSGGAEMAQVSFRPQYAGKEEYTGVWKIYAVKQVREGDYLLEIYEGDRHRAVSLWGDNLRNLADQNAGFGSDTDAWIGKSIRLFVETKNGKNFRIIKAEK
jgi:hypothetical protein